ADRRVVFRRVADGTCATAVVFPSLGIQKALPLNTDVAVELPPDSHGELAFQCGMGMYRGKVVAE
ncbi:MAG TPA: cupredoxin domain-containing protein, partial [Polyangiaceae bacterium]|nr:cupredoxin domain-containing protein [Polyangiaceae bacterium]